MLRGLGPAATTADVRALLQAWSAYIEEARAISASSGECRGFAYVTFVHVDYARQFMDATKGMPRIMAYRAWLTVCARRACDASGQ